MSVAPKNSPMPNKRLIVIEKDEKLTPATPLGSTVAEVGRHIHFKAAVLDSFDVKGFEPLHYDLLVICGAIEFADRRWKRPSSWHRTLEVMLPVIDLKVWQKPDVVKALAGVLDQLTGDTWKLTFKQAKNLAPVGSRQMPLLFGQPKTFAVAYSNGLDSRAASALSGPEAEALCIRVAGKKNRRKTGDSVFTQIPFRVQEYRGNESSFRSRGFQFAAVTAIAAHLSSVTRVVVPESGQGALGPVLLPLYKIYRDYRNHPIFFRKMEHFIKVLLGSQIRFEQPRLWFTKGQTLSAFLQLPARSEQHLKDTHSCWQTRRVVNVGVRKQCGLCAACLLRRQSLHAAGVDEAPGTYIVSDLTVRDARDALAVIPQIADRDIMVEYGSVGARHLHQLAVMASCTDDSLRAHASQIAAATRETYEITLQKMRSMLQTHASEWQSFLSAQGDQSFLKSWMDGGRHG